MEGKKLKALEPNAAKQDLDAAVRAVKEGAKSKSFKEELLGGSIMIPKDLSRAERDRVSPTIENPTSKTWSNPKQEKRLKNGCLEKTTENPRYEATSPLIGEYIQHMKDHVLIRNFMGIWPSEKDLMLWI